MHNSVVIDKIVERSTNEVVYEREEEIPDQEVLMGEFNLELTTLVVEYLSKRMQKVNIISVLKEEIKDLPHRISISAKIKQEKRVGELQK